MPDAFQSRHPMIFPAPLLLMVIGLAGCGPAGPDRTLTAEVPLHLEEHLEQASVTGSQVPMEVPRPVEWDFAQPRPEWLAVPLREFPFEPTQLVRTDDALRVTLGKSKKKDNKYSLGAVYVEVPDWTPEDWAHVLVRARTTDKVAMLGLGFNLRDPSEKDSQNKPPFLYQGEPARIINDGTVQTYSLRADWTGGQWKGTWRQLILYAMAEGLGSLDILSVAVIPKEAGYAEERTGAREEIRSRFYRRTLYVHAPARLEYRVRVPEAGRLDLGLGVLRGDSPVTFRVAVGAESGQTTTVFEETYADKEKWGQRSVDLSRRAGQTVTLALETECGRKGTVSLWGAPTLTGFRRGGKPNVIFYVIDGGAAEQMSVYGYQRRTTPNLERLAAEGALFERAYSNSTSTKPSTASFMTSLQNSVTGGQTGLTDPVPTQAVTMAEHLHGAGYQTGVFIANPNAGSLSGLERGVDVMKESWEEFAYFGRENHKKSSAVLGEAFWSWRESYPGGPYWVHFQSTDVHAPQDIPIPAPFSGLFVSPPEFKTWKEWTDKLNKEGGPWPYSKAWEKTGLDRVAYYRTWQALYDQAMAHNDYQLGRLVQRLKDEGEWENTLLIVAADHSARAAGVDITLAMQETLPPRWNNPMFRPSVSRVPLLFVWPGHINGGQRLRQTVSMIDMLPTILDLLDLPMPEVTMGQSLAPLLTGTAGWKPRPVIFDELWYDLDRNKRGSIEMVDGRWGASLEVNPPPPKKEETEEQVQGRRPVPLLLYDLWNDPDCLKSIHEQRPDLVKKYTEFLEERWKAHQALAGIFSRSGKVPLSPEQSETLRSLGYIR
jgi:arylsulfatase A-like enzyme